MTRPVLRALAIGTAAVVVGAFWVAVIKPGRMLFEMAGVEEELAREAMRLAAHKLPLKTKFVTREDRGYA